MNRPNFKRFAYLLGNAGLLLIATFGLGMQYKHRHDLLDRRLIGAVLGNDFPLATALIRQGANPNARYGPPQPFSMRRLWTELLHHSTRPLDERATAFSLACGGHNDTQQTAKWRDRSEPAELVKFMLKNGADINAKGPYNTTALFWAVGENSPQIVAALLEHGADVNARDANGYTPLMNALQGKPAVLQMLLAHGADINATTQGGFTPLLIATRVSPNPATILLLLEHGASANAQSRDGVSALFRTVMMSTSPQDPWSQSVIPQLLAHGASPNLANRRGTTALQLAQQNKRPDLVAMMQQAKPTP